LDGACCASPEQRLRAGRRANFSAAKNLPFYTSKNKKNLQNFQGTELQEIQNHN